MWGPEFPYKIGVLVERGQVGADALATAGRLSSPGFTRARRSTAEWGERWTVKVVGKSRSNSMSSGKFTDALATEYADHVYKIFCGQLVGYPNLKHLGYYIERLCVTILYGVAPPTDRSM